MYVYKNAHMLHILYTHAYIRLPAGRVVAVFDQRIQSRVDSGEGDHDSEVALSQKRQSHLDGWVGVDKGGERKLKYFLTVKKRKKEAFLMGVFFLQKYFYAFFLNGFFFCK